MSDKSSQNVSPAEGSSSISSSISSSTSISNSERENSCLTPPKTQFNTDHHQHPSAKKQTVFERNYQFARIYEQKRRVLVEKLEANEAQQRGFKAKPIRVVEFRAVKNTPKFTIPTTPKVLKHNFVKQTVKE